MYIYRIGADSFGALTLVPQDFFKFWDGEIDTNGIGVYTKPLDILPEITWEIDLTADEWRDRIANADTVNPIPIAKLREIPDSYLEAVFLNMIYGYNMNYNSSRAQYMPIRIGYTFTQSPMAYPAYALVMLGIKTLIDDAINTATPVSTENATQLRNLLRHITYVAVVIARANVPMQPTGVVFVSAVTSRQGTGRESVFYDVDAMDAFVAKGGTVDLTAANWVQNQTSPTDETIDQSAALLATWKTLTDITAS